MSEIAVGIDIGGTNSHIGIVSDTGEVLQEDQVSTRDYPRAEHFVQETTRKIQLILEKNRDHQFKGIGIGAPNGNFFNGTIEYAPNLIWEGIVPLVDMFSERFDEPAVLTNDANAAAIGEMMFGGARGMKDFILITLGTGLGSGIVVNGDLVYGHNGFAGEIGHTFTLFEDGRDCGCGRRGCLETYASAQGIKRTVFELLANRMEESELRDYTFNQMTSEHIYQAALNKDPLALEAFDRTGRYLGKKLADSVAHTTPQAIYLYGGLAKSGNLLLDPTRKYFQQYLLNIFQGEVTIECSELNEKFGAILGAAALVWKKRK